MASYRESENQLLYYEIRIKSYIDCDWSDWFEGLKVTREEGGITLLSGPISDQAALYGLLRKINDLNLTLLSFNMIETGTNEILKEMKK